MSHVFNDYLTIVTLRLPPFPECLVTAAWPPDARGCAESDAEKSADFVAAPPGQCRCPAADWISSATLERVNAICRYINALCGKMANQRTAPFIGLVLSLQFTRVRGNRQ